MAALVIERAQQQHGVCAVFVPEDPSSFEAQVDNSTDRAFHRAATHGQVLLSGNFELETMAIVEEVVFLRFNLLPLLPRASRFNGVNERIDVSPFQTSSLLAYPLFLIGG